MKALLVCVAVGLTTGAFALDDVWDNGFFGTGTTTSTGAPAPSFYYWSELQSVGGITHSGIGFNNNGAAGNRVADNFTLTQDKYLAYLTLYEFQAGSTMSSTLTGLTVQYWNGRPGDAGSSVVFGDATTNILSTGGVGFVNGLRIFNNQPDTNRPIMQINIPINRIFLAGTYWIDWSATGSLTDGPSAVPVTLTGALGKTGADARQFSAGAWQNAVDPTSGVAQDFSFSILGAAVPEPASMAALGLGLVAVLRRRTKR